MKAQIYKKDGTEKGKIDIPTDIFDVKWNADLVHQVVVSMQSNARTNVAHTKDRSDVRGGGRKPWRQKGTGRARHGSRRSPIWVGGGVTFGPQNVRNFNKKINKKMKTKALFSVLSKKFEEGEILFIDELTFSKPRTKEVKVAIDNLSGIKGFEGLSTKRKNTAFLAFGSLDINTKRSFNNFSNMETDEIRNLNLMDVLTYKYLVIVDPKKSFEFLESKISKDKKDK